MIQARNDESWERVLTDGTTGTTNAGHTATIAAAPGTPPAVLAEIADSRPDLWPYLAANPALDPRLLRQLYTRGSDPIRVAIGARPATWTHPGAEAAGCDGDQRAADRPTETDPGDGARPANRAAISGHLTPPLPPGRSQDSTVSASTAPAAGPARGDHAGSAIVLETGRRPRTRRRRWRRSLTRPWALIAVGIVLVVVASIGIVGNWRSSRPIGEGVVGAMPNQPSVAWQIEPVTGPVSGNSLGTMPMASAGNTWLVVVPRAPGGYDLAAIDATTGRFQWRIDPDESVTSCADRLLRDRLVCTFVDDARTQVRMFNITSGRETGSFHLDNADRISVIENQIVSIVDGGTTCQAQRYTEDGQRMWSGPVFFRDSSSLRQDQCTANLIGSTLWVLNGHKAQALNWNTGEQVTQMAAVATMGDVDWNVNALDSSQVALLPEAVAVGTSLTKVSVFDRQAQHKFDLTGRILPIWGGYRTAPYHRRLIIDGGDTVSAIDVETGHRQWQMRLTATAVLLETADEVIVTTESGLACVDNNGTIRWRIADTLDDLGPAFTDGHRAIMMTGGQLRAISLRDGSQVWSYSNAADGFIYMSFGGRIIGINASGKLVALRSGR